VRYAHLGILERLQVGVQKLRREVDNLLRIVVLQQAKVSPSGVLGVLCIHPRLCATVTVMRIKRIIVMMQRRQVEAAEHSAAGRAVVKQACRLGASCPGKRVEAIGSVRRRSRIELWSPARTDGFFHSKDVDEVSIPFLHLLHLQIKVVPHALRKPAVFYLRREVRVDVLPLVMHF